MMTGRENAITSVIEPRSKSYSTNAADRDWYRFDAVAGQTYVIELFNVVNNLALVSESYNCNSSSNSGLWIAVYDSSENEVVRQCNPIGAGNVHTILQLTAGVSGSFYILVTPHAATVSGSYSLRVLPKYDEPGASWEEVTFEPNNRSANAYPIQVGRENALTSAIELRSKSYSTNTADSDLYRFDAVGGQTYLVELFNVNNSLELVSASYNCDSSTNSGLWLLVHDQYEHEVVRQCRPEGLRDVHSSVEFTAGVNGIFYIQVAPHDATVSGNYSLRVLPQSE